MNQLGLFSSNEDADDIATAGRGCKAQPSVSDMVMDAKDGTLKCRYEVYAPSSYAWGHSCTNQRQGA